MLLGLETFLFTHNLRLVWKFFFLLLNKTLIPAVFCFILLSLSGEKGVKVYIKKKKQLQKNRTNLLIFFQNF